jgi:uncharacterized protein YecT (DUF1311 family)
MRYIQILTVFMLFIASPANAMDFKLFFQPDMQLNIVVAEGEIEEGDAQKFKAIYPKADRDEEGDIILVLNSMGGSVPAAFEMAKIIDDVGVYTLVPEGALCASACASILYTAGNRRNLMEGGSLGFHTCYLSDGETVEKSSFCNEVIAEHAMANGLDHASVSLFVNSYGPGEIAWVGPDVACSMLFGMCRKSLKEEFLDKELDRHMDFITGMVEEFSKKSPSFDCSKAATTQENLICDSGELSSLDKEMAELYKISLSESSAPENIKTSQKAWLRYSRNVCKTEACLIDSYKMRIKELSE